MPDSDMRPKFHFPSKDQSLLVPKEKFTKPPRSLTPEEISNLDLSEAREDSLSEGKGKKGSSSYGIWTNHRKSS